MTYGTRIKQAREARRLTQEQLAEQLNVSRQAVSKWEAGLSRPTKEKLDKLSEILDVPPDTWAEIDAAAAGRPPDASRPWKIATAGLAAVCLVLAVCLAASLRSKPEPAPEDPAPTENLPAASVPEEEPAEAVRAFPLTVQRDYDFGDLPFGQYDAAEIPFLNDWERVAEEEIWCGWFPDGTRLSLIPVNAPWDESNQYSNVYLLYAPSAEMTGGVLEYRILYRIGEDYTGDGHGDPEGEAFVSLLGYDGFKISISAEGGLYRSAHYITQRSDGTPCIMANTNADSCEFDVDDDGLPEILTFNKYLPGLEIMDTVEGEEGAFIYTLDYTKTAPEWDHYVLSFDAERGGFVVIDGNTYSVVSRCVLRDGELVQVPPTDFSALDYPDAAGTKITFITDQEQEPVLSDGLDPDDILPYTPNVRITHRQQAYLALQELYNITGLKLEECYCAANEYSVHFSLLPDGFNQRGFFHFDFNTRYGNVDHIPSLYIYWQELGNDWSPLSLEQSIHPESWVQGEAEAMLWYYDRMKVFSTEEPGRANPGELWLENGDLYTYFLEETEFGPALTGITGPYPGGVVNH